MHGKLAIPPPAAALANSVTDINLFGHQIDRAVALDSKIIRSSPCAATAPPTRPRERASFLFVEIINTPGRNIYFANIQLNAAPIK